MKDLSDRLAALSPEQRKLLETRLQQKGLQAPRLDAVRPIPDREQHDHFPTSLDQERLWFIDQMEPGNPAYNIHTTTRMAGPMDVALMREAINLLIARHEVLRTTFHVVDGKPVQVVAPELEIDLPITDLSHLSEAEREEAAQRVAVEAAAVRFDMERGPLIQVRLARLGPEDHLLMICMQHAITDRWSFDVLENEIGQVYQALREGREIEFPPLPIQFADFAAWQRKELSGEAGQRHLGYWRNRLAGAPLVLEIPTDRPRPPVQTFNGGRVYTVYPDALLRELKSLTQQCGATMFMTTLAALDVLCWKYSGQRDLIIGSAIADRNRSETENVLGYFLNMLLLRATIDPAMTFRDLMKQVRETASGAYSHQDVPFARLVEELKPRQDPSRTPLIQVSYIYLDFPVLTTPEEAGFSASSLDVDNGASRFDLTLACTELPGEGIHSYFEYNTDLYDEPKVRRMLAHLERILEFGAAQPDRPLRELDLLAPEERAELGLPETPQRGSDPGSLRTNSALEGAGVLPEDRPAERDTVIDRAPDSATGARRGRLHGGLERRAAQQPDAPALVFGETVLSFAELNDAADAVARRLRDTGVREGALVPICAERSIEQIAAIIGVSKSGAAYVPFDPSLPAPRMAAILSDVAPGVILVQSHLRDRLPETEASRLDLDPFHSGASGAREGDRPTELPPAPDARGLAYVMFTSGSTGVPKGVTVPHAAIGNRIRWSQNRYPLRPGDRVLHNASFGFDIAAWELFGPLDGGATVVVPGQGEHRDPAALVRLMHEHAITVAHFVPSVLRTLLDEPQLRECHALRLVFCGGESLDRELFDRFGSVLPGRTLAHFYGPTEAAISCLSWNAEPDLRPGPVPLGRPISNMRVHLLDTTGQPVPKGVPGEIHIGGVGLAWGYLCRPKETAERFVPDWISGEPGARLYRTGDLARFREDGDLEFLGRLDHQIKVRGYRIEPGEIESVLERMDSVDRAVVVARGEGARMQMVAYVAAPGTAESGAQAPGAPSESDMRAAIRRVLPEYMVPAAFVVLDRIPVNANGKIDRAALPEPGTQQATATYVPPATPTEETIASIWQTLLDREPVGAEDDFFDLGGNSLLATQAVSRMRAAFAIEFPLRRFFEGSSVRLLATAVDELLLGKLESMSEEEATRLLESMRSSSPPG